MVNEPGTQTLTVSALNAYIKAKLEGDFSLSSFSLRGEVSNFKIYPSGHCYFTLKDRESAISCVMWASSAGRLSFHPQDGDEVLVHGRISVYPPRGAYQVSVDKMERFGQGEELLRLERLKAKLKAEGLFDPARKRPIPKFPKKVAVIAGKDSAGLRDIVVNLLNRYPLVELCVFPSLVQGKDAPKDLIANLVRSQEAKPDTLILARGGGSSEDLAAFNDETLVRALSNNPCPVISAVGHEVDTTLCDYVADLRVSTPTAAAVAAVPDKNEIRQGMDESLMRLQNAVTGLLSALKEKVGSLSSRAFFLRPESLYAERLEQLGVTERRMELAMGNLLEGKKRSLASLSAQLTGVNPERVFARGYSMTTDETGRVLRSVDDATPGSLIKTHVKDGIIQSRVLDTPKESNDE